MLEKSDEPNPFTSWDVARKTLDDAIQHYLDSSIALAAAVSRPSSLFSDQSSFEAAVNSIRDDIHSLKSRQARLESAQIPLGTIQNKSTVLIPFNKLPLEIMIRIFHVAAGRSCACDSISQTLHRAKSYGPRTLLTITHICTYWREIVIGESSLWTHVTFHLNRPGDFTDGPNCPQTWLRRARNAPSYIHLDGRPLGRQEGGRIAELVASQLLPYLSKIVGFRFTTGWTYSMTRWFLLKLLAEGGADSVREFIHLGGSGPWGNQELLLASPSYFLHGLKSPMPALRILHTDEMCFAWDSTIYVNLVELRLEGLHEACYPTIEQLLRVLSACPDLQLLSLCATMITGRNDPHHTPVTLRALELLDISHMNPETLVLLLPLISPGKRELSIKINCMWADDVQTIEVITSFFTRSRVTGLFLLEAKRYCISKYLASLRNLHVLIIDFHSKQGDGSLDAITYFANPDSGQLSARCPNLRSLYLLNGALTNNTVQTMVEVHTLKRLTFGACFLDPFEEELLHWLKPMVEDVMCVKRLNWDLPTNWHLYMK